MEVDLEDVEVAQWDEVCSVGGMYDLYLETLFSFTHIFLGLSCSCTSPLPSFLLLILLLFFPFASSQNIIILLPPPSPPALRLAWILCSAFLPVTALLSVCVLRCWFPC